MSGKRRFGLTLPWASRGGPPSAGSFVSSLTAQQSSMSTYAQPWSIRPVETMASAASRMILSLTRNSQMYQLFQPICGVRAKVSPQTILNFRSALPSALAARNITSYVPGCLIAPVIWPVSRIDFQALRQAVDRELHRPLAGGGDRQQKRVSRPHAEHPGPR